MLFNELIHSEIAAVCLSRLAVGWGRDGPRSGFESLFGSPVERPCRSAAPLALSFLFCKMGQYRSSHRSLSTTRPPPYESPTAMN